MIASPAMTWLVPFFGRTDVAFVYLVSAVPFALAVAAFTVATRRLVVASLLAAASVGAGVFLATHNGGSASVWLLRPVFATAVVGTLATCWTRTSRLTPPSLQSRGFAFLLGAVVAVAPPTAYAVAAADLLRDRLRELQSQSRIGEAAIVANALASLDPTAQVDGRPVGELRTTLNLQVTRASHTLPGSLPADASRDVRLAAAEGWAMLGETDRAIDLLTPLITSGRPDPAACSLLGTIGQSREQWEESRFWFATAAAGWSAAGAEHRLVEALLGVAYADRKLGRLREAEAAYQRTLAHAPTAETHFLLAQFYADSQRALDAATHVEQAIALDPSYSAAGTRLRERLMTHEFGCLPVFLGNRRPASGAAALAR